MLSELWPALTAGFLWAISAPIISAGLSRARAQHNNRFVAVAVGLYVAMLCGFLAIWAVSGFANPVRSLSAAVVLGGLFTFPIGTGLYYVCSAAFRDRAAIASQFSNVKPLFSIAAGGLIFGESIAALDLTVLMVIVIGVGVMLYGTMRRGVDAVPIGLGLALALCWSAGESFVRSATGGTTTLDITLGALFSSVVLSTPALALLIYAEARKTGDRPAAVSAHLVPTLVPFALHGMISFGAAYYFFFKSIGMIGLSRTVMVTVAWPALAMAIDVILRLARHRPISIPASTAIGLSLFTVAAAIHVLVPAS